MIITIRTPIISIFTGIDDPPISELIRSNFSISWRIWMNKFSWTSGSMGICSKSDMLDFSQNKRRTCCLFKCCSASDVFHGLVNELSFDRKMTLTKIFRKIVLHFTTLFKLSCFHIKSFHSTGRGGRLRIFRQTSTCHAFLGAKLLRRVRQRRRNDVSRWDAHVLISSKLKTDSNNKFSDYSIWVLWKLFRRKPNGQLICISDFETKWKEGKVPVSRLERCATSHAPGARSPYEKKVEMALLSSPTLPVSSSPISRRRNPFRFIFSPHIALGLVGHSGVHSHPISPFLLLYPSVTSAPSGAIQSFVTSSPAYRPSSSIVATADQSNGHWKWRTHLPPTPHKLISGVVLSTGDQKIFFWIR